MAPRALAILVRHFARSYALLRSDTLPIEQVLVVLADNARVPRVYAGGERTLGARLVCTLALWILARVVGFVYPLPLPIDADKRRFARAFPFPEAVRTGTFRAVFCRDALPFVEMEAVRAFHARLVQPFVLPLLIWEQVVFRQRGLFAHLAPTAVFVDAAVLQQPPARALPQCRNLPLGIVRPSAVKFGLALAVDKPRGFRALYTPRRVRPRHCAC